MSVIFKIKGLDCANCATELEREIQKIDGIASANINFIMEKMELEYDESNEKDILKRLKKVIKREEPDVSIEKL